MKGPVAAHQPRKRLECHGLGIVARKYHDDVAGDRIGNGNSIIDALKRKFDAPISPFTGRRIDVKRFIRRDRGNLCD